MDIQDRLLNLYNTNIENRCEMNRLIQELKDKDELDFDAWYKYAEKIDYQWIISRNKAPYIRGLTEDCEKYSTIKLDTLLEWAEDGYDGDMLREIKKEIMNLNFGSMVIDW